MKRIAIVVPAYNEEASIEKVVNNIHAIAKKHDLLLQPVVVNDCSKDTTGKIIADLNCVAINLPINLGIGGAVQTGYKYAYENGFDYAIQTDGDGQHPAEEIPNMLKVLEEKQLDVVVGSRFITKEGYQSSFMRRLGIQYFMFLNRVLIGLKITDNTSGFRLINRKALAIVSNYYPDEYPEPEAIILYHKRGLKIGEVPVVMLERQGGQSSISSSHSIYYMFKVSLAIIFTFIRLRKSN